MASIKQINDRKFKITVSNGYRPNGKKICKAKTITVPDSVKPRGIRQYVAHEAEELERLVKSGFAEDRDTTFETYATRWLERQVKYAPGTLASYRRMLETGLPLHRSHQAGRAAAHGSGESADRVAKDAPTRASPSRRPPCRNT